MYIHQAVLHIFVMIRIGRICWTSRHLGDHFIHSPGLYVQSTSNALVMRKCGADLRSASCRHPNITAVASIRRTEALASVKFYQILSIFIFFIRLIILEDFKRLISYNGACVRLGCSDYTESASVAQLRWMFPLKFGSVKTFVV